VFGSATGIQYEQERNLDMDSAQADRVSNAQIDLSLAFSFDPHPPLSGLSRCGGWNT
jgi:hypothetical protein